MLHSPMLLIAPRSFRSTPSRIPNQINLFHTLVFRHSRNSLIHHDLRTLRKNTGVAPHPRPTSSILDLPMSPRYCANETPVASQPHPAALPNRAPVRSFSFREFRGATAPTVSLSRPESSLVPQ